MDLLALDAQLDNEVSFITGVAANGQLAAQSFWSWNQNTPATYGTAEIGKWGGGAAGTGGGVVTYGFDPTSNWTATEQKAFAATFALWSEVANITFVQSSNPTTAQIDITRSTAATGSEGGLDFTAAAAGSGNLGTGTTAEIQIATSTPGFGPVGASFSDYGGYPYLTLIHEEGHAIGLGHAGPYDANVTTNSQDDQAQLGPYDVQAYSVMSYIEANDTSASRYSQEPAVWNYGSANGDNGEYYDGVPTTPQIADILAAQRLYGLPTTTPLSGGQTFGFHCNVSGPTEPFFDFTVNTAPVVTLWDAGGNNTLDLSGYSTAETINLNPGTFSSCAGLQNNIAIAFGTEIDSALGGSGYNIFHANNGNDILYGGTNVNSFFAGTGTDVMFGGGENFFSEGQAGTDYYIGKWGDDLQLSGSAQSYDYIGQYTWDGYTFNVLFAHNGGGLQYIDASIMFISFAGEQIFSPNTAAGFSTAGVNSGGSPTEYSLIGSPSSFNFDAASGSDKVVLSGNVGDYSLSRAQPGSTPDDGVGTFVLTTKNGTGAYAIDQNISTVQFQNGQYLSLKDLPSYVHGDASLQMGGSGDDLLFQTPSNAYELFIGGGGNDTVYLNGNVGDYTLKSFTAVTPLGENGTGGQSYSGLELVGDNGSGLLLIDSSVETVQFKNGQYLSYNDLHAYIATDTTSSSDVLNVGLDGDFGEPLVYQGASGANRALLNGNVKDYTLSRDASGDFVLDEHYATNGVEDTLTLTQNVEGVQFHNGQYLSLKDLGAYIPGSDVFTQGTAGNDLLFLPLSGDQYVVGGAGTDNLYLNGNTHDYTIKAVDLAAANGHPAIDGYELVGDNGSGNIYIDQSTEIIHFQNGQYLAFHDLPAYVDPFHG